MRGKEFALEPFALGSRNEIRQARFVKTGFAIFINSLTEGIVPLVFDEGGKPAIFSTKVEAQREIADNMISRLQEFIVGERDFDDAVLLEECILKVVVQADGSIRVFD